MARVTVEDCVTKVTNRFDLVLYSSQRARHISSGGSLLVERDRDKNPVVALREIAEDKLKPEDLREDIIHGLQKHVEVDEPEEDELDTLMKAADEKDEEGETEDEVKKAKGPEKDVQETNLEKETLEKIKDAEIIEPEDE